jgi:hypothetical protein
MSHLYKLDLATRSGNETYRGRDMASGRHCISVVIPYSCYLCEANSQFIYTGYQGHAFLI